MYVTINKMNLEWVLFTPDSFYRGWCGYYSFRSLHIGPVGFVFDQNLIFSNMLTRPKGVICMYTKKQTIKSAICDTGLSVTLQPCWVRFWTEFFFLELLTRQEGVICMYTEKEQLILPFLTRVFLLFYSVAEITIIIVYKNGRSVAAWGVYKELCIV